MCDTFVALPDATADGSVIFGKNSDREINEAHELLIVPRARHAAGSKLRTTYIEIPQVAETYAVLLARPYWLWGAEMGANEHGVVIGNQALFTRVAHESSPGLIGMDLLRLALERAATARDAVRLMTALLEQYGQAGNCGHAWEFHYHNGFIVADPAEAWVLETAGREWAAVRITSGVRSISNAITIEGTWDLASAGLVDVACRNGWCRSRNDFSFARCYSDRLYTYFSAAKVRQSCTTARLQRLSGRLRVGDAMSVLRDHGSEAGPGWSPSVGLTGANVCNHGGFGPVRRASQSVGSMVAHLRRDGNTHWLTGTSAPCTSIFKPVWIDAGLPDLGPAPHARFCEDSLWWRHELLHRATLRDFPTRVHAFAGQRDTLERQFLEREADERNGSSDRRLEFSAACFGSAADSEHDWLERVHRIPLGHGRSWHHSLAWKLADRDAELGNRET